MEQEIRKRVVALTKRSQDMMQKETGVLPSMTEDDLKTYLEHVIKELKKPVGSNNPTNR